MALALEREDRTGRTRRLLLAALIACIVVTAILVFSRNDEMSPAGLWLDRHGEAVPNGQRLVLDVFAGSHDCYSDTILLAMAWPLARPVPGGFMSDPRTRIYVWQEAQQQPVTNQVVTSAVVESMPPDARDTGLHRGPWHLWVSPSTLDRAVFLTAGDTIQRWAFVSQFLPCM